VAGAVSHDGLALLRRCHEKVGHYSPGRLAASSEFGALALPRSRN
jgi:hypothetical protein